MARVSFAARGGWWVAAQVPILLLAFLVPLWTSGVEAAQFRHPVQYLGALLVVLGLGVIAAGLIALGQALTPFPRPRRDAPLVTRGVYGLVRHPIYSGLIAAALGWAVVWLSLVGGLYALLVAGFFDRKAVREEAWLRERYPDYPAYARRVRRFIPGAY